jgi:hypothetical protein
MLSVKQERKPMARDHRIVLNGAPVNYTCENSRFQTNLSKGQAHGAGQASGSVFGQALVTYPGGSLWLEHVADNQDPGQPYYWLMHYDPTGMPSIPLSGIMSKEDLEEMARLMASLLP